MDKYDIHVAELTAIKDDYFTSTAHRDWINAKGIFQFLNNDRERPTKYFDQKVGKLYSAGCISMIKNVGTTMAFKDGRPLYQFSQGIKDDPRLDTSPYRLTKEMLPAFAEWQRKYDELTTVNQ